MKLRASSIASLPFFLPLLLACQTQVATTPPPGGDDDASAPVDSGGPASEAGKLTAEAGSAEAGDAPDAAGPKVACSPNGGGCTCVATATGSSAAGTCPAPAMPQPQCCANANYPGTAISECTCQNYVCTAMNDGACFCGIDATGTAVGATCPGTYSHCCVDTTTNASCTCGLSPCAAGDREVTSCGVDLLQCGPLTVPVAGCR